MTALVIDDEPLARTHLRRLLVELGVQVVGEASDAVEGIALVEEYSPDAVFLDVRMPGISGIEAAFTFTCLESPPMVILVTGYSEYAVEAFSHSALDYIVKPVSRERLAASLGKARRLMGLQRKAIGVKSPRRIVRQSALQRLPIRVRGAIRLLAVEKIVYAMASEKSVVVKVKDQQFRTSFTLKELEEILPASFMRIHSSCLVNLAAIEEIQLLGNRTYGVKVVTGEELPVGRLQYPKLQERLGLPPAA